MYKNINGLNVSMKRDKEHQPIIFIHGFPFDHTLWDDIISKLENRYYCISYDVRGLGCSELQSDQYTMESFVDDLDHIIAQLELIDVILCGFSMGGYIALRSNKRLSAFNFINFSLIF